MDFLTRKKAPAPAPAFDGRATADPVPRLLGPVRADCLVDGGRVAEALVGVRMFRDLENVLAGRPPSLAAHLARRVSGFSPAAYGLGACLALEQAWGARIPTAARLVRNIAIAAEMLQAHLTCFFLQDLPGLAGVQPLGPAPGPRRSVSSRGPGPGNATVADERPGQDGWRGLDPQLRLAAWEASRESVAVRRICAEVVALLAGRWPHPPGLVPGGAGQALDQAALEAVGWRLQSVARFVRGRWAPLAYDLALARRELFDVGRGPGKFLCAGALPMNDHATHHLLAAGTWINGRLEGFRPELVTENADRGWFVDERAARPLDQNATRPDLAKPRAYSFVKAARYGGECCETGPLARAVVANASISDLGLERLRGVLGRNAKRFREAGAAMVSANGRRLARVEESLRLCEALTGFWMAQLSPGDEVWSPPGERPEASGQSWTESAEGTMGLAVHVAKGRASSWGIVTAGGFNLGPRDQAGRPGAVEQALVGCRAGGAQGLAQVAEVIHSFAPDPAAAAQ